MKSHYLPEPLQTQAQHAQVVRLPLDFTADGRGYTQAWRSKSVVVYLRDNPGNDHSTHLYFAFQVRVIGGMENIGNTITSSANLDHCINSADKWEREQ